MSKKNKKKNKIEKNSSNFSEGGFDKSILSDYSQLREDYSEKEIDPGTLEFIEQNVRIASYDLRSHRFDRNASTDSEI